MPTERKAVYLAFSRRMADVYREHGATRIIDYRQVSNVVNQDDFHAEGLTNEPGDLQGLASVSDASAFGSVIVTVT